MDLYEGLASDLDYNVMFSQHGHLTLAHTDRGINGLRERAEMNQIIGVNSRPIFPEAIQLNIRFLLPLLMLRSPLDTLARMTSVLGLADPKRLYPLACSPQISNRDPQLEARHEFHPGGSLGACNWPCSSRRLDRSGPDPCKQAQFGVDRF